MAPKKMITELLTLLMIISLSGCNSNKSFPDFSTSLQLSVENSASEEEQTLPQLTSSPSASSSASSSKTTLPFIVLLSGSAPQKGIFYIAAPGNYFFTMKNSKCRLEIQAYDSDYQPTNTIDVGSGDYASFDNQVAYVTFAPYLYSSGNVTDTEIALSEWTESESGYAVKIESISFPEQLSAQPELLACEIHPDSLSNPANYRYGWYISWGGTYEETSGSLCTRNKYGVEPKSYTINCNDSRISVSIQEYDADGKWNLFAGSFTNGMIWTPDEQTAYVTLTLRSSVWGVDLYSLLENGLKCYPADCLLEGLPVFSEFADFSFGDFSCWRPGAYVSQTGDFGISATELCTKSLLSLSEADRNKPYIIKLPSSHLMLQVLEMDANQEVLLTGTFSDGQKWTPSTQTAYLGLTLSGDSSYVYDDYRKIFLDKETPIILEEFMRYAHDTAMDNLTASDFSSLMNVGWNLGNSLDSHYGDRTDNGALSQETLWGNIIVTEDLINYVSELGFNTIRIPVTWYYNTYNDSSGLHIHKEWLERVQDVVDYAISNDMYVIINSHHDQPIFYAGTDEVSFRQVLSDTEDLWKEIGTYFQDYDEHLIFEAYNEIDNLEKSWNFSEKAAEQMNRMNQVFVNTIRSIGGNNAERILMVPTLLDGYTDEFLNAFSLPIDIVPDRLLVQVHNYSQQFDQDIEPLFTHLEEFSKKIGAPVIIGEFGTKPDYTPAEYRATAMGNYVARAAAHGIKCIYWDDGNLNHYGLIDRRDFSHSEHTLLQALLFPATFETTDKHAYRKMSDFIWMTLNQDTGELKEDPWWGSIVTDEAIRIPADASYLTLSLVTTGNAVGQRIHYVHFYDNAGNLLEARNDNTGYTANTHAIPEGAYTVRIGINCSNHATSEKQYRQYFADGDLVFVYSFLDIKK